MAETEEKSEIPALDGTAGVLPPSNVLERPDVVIGRAQARRGDILSVAPMMQQTTVPFRALARILSRCTKLYTEMVVSSTLWYAPWHALSSLGVPSEQKPVALQLGGNDPDELRFAVRVALMFDYDEINLNCGCPSDKVAGRGCFGAAMMLEPELTGRCVRAMLDEVARFSEEREFFRRRFVKRDTDAVREVLLLRSTEEDGCSGEETKGEEDSIREEKEDEDSFMGEEKKEDGAKKHKDDEDGFLEEEKKGASAKKHKEDEDGFLGEEDKGVTAKKHKEDEDSFMGEEDKGVTAKKHKVVEYEALVAANDRRAAGGDPGRMALLRFLRERGASVDRLATIPDGAVMGKEVCIPLDCAEEGRDTWLLAGCTTGPRVHEVEVTVKCRLGADECDSWEDFEKFVSCVVAAGCRHLIVHARKCWLHGLSTKDNRTVPPLRYDWVRRAARQWPHVRFSLNGGIKTLVDAQKVLAWPDRIEDEEGKCIPAKKEIDFEGDGDCVPAKKEIDFEGDVHHSSPSKIKDEDRARFPAPERISFPPMPHAAGPKVLERLASDALWTEASVGWEPPAYYSHLVEDAISDEIPPMRSRHAEIDSVMIGRGAWSDPWHLLGRADTVLFGCETDPCPSRAVALERYLEFVARAEEVEQHCVRLNIHVPRWAKRLELIKPIQRLYTERRYRANIIQATKDKSQSLVKLCREFFAKELESKI